MCGIVGYVGQEQAAPILLDGLSKLEYRGYDSAGVCVFDEGVLKVAKAKGHLQALIDLTGGGKTLHGCVGIGHTRWATHGAPSDTNSHPHMADSGKIAVVHNGIIENYLELKELLMARGKKFHSETDTEVVANLIEFYYDMGCDFKDAVQKAVSRVEGSYALGVLCRDYPDTIIGVKKDSPLIFGYGQGCNFIASDVPAILKYTRDVVYLNDGDLLVMDKDSVQFYDQFGEHIQKQPEHVSWELSAAEKGGYAHFMLKEIHEQPKAVRDTIHPRIRDGRVVLDDIQLPDTYLEHLKRIYIVACGSAYYVGIHGKYIIENLCQVPVEPVLASEFRYADPVLDDTTLVVIISQSGETADTLAALREAKRAGCRVLSVVNVVGSTIATESDDVLYTWAGPEISVASTKAYSTQLAVIYLLALYIGEQLGKFTQEQLSAYIAALEKLPEQIDEMLKHKENIQFFASKYFNASDMYFIGRNVDYAASLEASLKLKEISYIHSEAYAAGELKHGPISLIEDGTLVIALATDARLFDKMMSNIKEVKARGAVVLGVATEDKKEIAGQTDMVFYIPKTASFMLPSLSVIPMQLFAYYVASMKGCDIDKPRNLAKSVTVE